MEPIVIASAARTPVGSFNGSFANVPAHELGATAIKGALERAGVDPADVDEVIMGQILAAGEGQNPARQAHIKAGLPIESAAWGLNQVCGSGLRAVALGAGALALSGCSLVGGDDDAGSSSATSSSARQSPRSRASRPVMAARPRSS